MTLRKETKAQPIEAKAIEDIRDQGICIGKGKNGIVYKIGDWAYKIFLENSSSLGYDPAERGARYWNKIYKTIYNREYQDLPPATHIDLPSKKKKDIKAHVLIMPFIEGEEFGSFMHYRKYSKQFRTEFKKLSLKMLDWNVQGNVRVTTSGFALPVDVDCVFSRPRKTGFRSVEFDPPSPLTKLYISKKFNFYNVSYKEKVEIASADHEKKQELKKA